MGDLNPTQSGLTVKICDGDSDEKVAVTTVKPSSSEAGLAVREVQRGQQTAADSIPVTMATDQDPIDISIPRDLVANSYLQISGNTIENAIISAGGSGVFLDVATLTFASNRNCQVIVRAEAGGPVKLVIDLDGNAPFQHLVFQSFLLQDNANNPWTAQLDSSNATVDITITAYIKT